MLVGGVDPHRYDLSSMVMLKDNHIWSKGVAVRLYISTALTYFSSETGSIPKAVQAARSVCGFSLRIDVECTSEQEAIQAIEAGADVIMLDNFTSDQIQECCSSLKQKYGQDNVGNSRRKWLIEVSGGVTPENFEEHVHPGEPYLGRTTGEDTKIDTSLTQMLTLSQRPQYISPSSTSISV